MSNNRVKLVLGVITILLVDWLILITLVSFAIAVYATAQLIWHNREVINIPSSDQDTEQAGEFILTEIH